MAEGKRQETSKQSSQRQRQQQGSSNPFAHYVSQKEGEEGEVGVREKRRRSHSSQKGKDRQSRSRSRQKQHRQLKEEFRPNKRYEDDHYYRRDRDRDRPQYPRPRRDEAEDHSHFKTRICPLFEKGQCKRGETCNFAHGQKQLRGLPNFKKTRICIPFKNGQCPRSSNECNYAHGQAELKRLVYDYFPQKNQTPNNTGLRPQKTYRDSPYRQRDGYRGRGDRDRERERYRGRYDGPKEYGSKDNPPPNYPPHGYGPYMSHYNNPYMFPPSMGGYGPPGELYPPPSSLGGSSSNVPAPTGSYPGGGQSNAYPYGMPGYEYNYGYYGGNYGGFNSSSSSV